MTGFYNAQELPVPKIEIASASLFLASGSSSPSSRVDDSGGNLVITKSETSDFEFMHVSLIAVVYEHVATARSTKFGRYDTKDTVIQRHVAIYLDFRD